MSKKVGRDYRVLVSDPISEQGLDKLREKALVDVKTGLKHTELLDIIGEYDALIVRSETIVDKEILEAGKRLKVVGRAGVGVDNIDVEAATENGIVVINAPSGNTISTAEHTMAMMTSLARNIPSAARSLKAGQWKRSAYMGIELYKKVLGIIGFGRVGSEVAKRAKAMGMEVIVYDPYISEEKAAKSGVSPVSLDTLCRTADIITLHTPLTSKTRHIIGQKELAIMKDGVRIINCARGGLIDEKSLYEALKAGKVAGAALDVFEDEPCTENPLFDLDNVIVTPHLGASTLEAQINVALQVAEQVIAALEGEPVLNAINVQGIDRETFVGIKPFLPLMKILGSFYTQVFGGQVKEVEVLYSGDIARFKVAPLTTYLLIGLFSPILHETVNFVNAPHVARQRGILVREMTSSTVEDFTNLVTVHVKTADGINTIAGTLFKKKDCRIVQIGKHRIEAIPSRYMIVTNHVDIPGVIGSVGTILGKNNVNIAGMQVGRESIGGEAVMVVQVDSMVTEDIIRQIEKLPPIESVCFVTLEQFPEQS